MDTINKPEYLPPVIDEYDELKRLFIDFEFSSKVNGVDFYLGRKPKKNVFGYYIKKDSNGKYFVYEYLKDKPVNILYEGLGEYQAVREFYNKYIINVFYDNNLRDKYLDSKNRYFVLNHYDLLENNEVVNSLTLSEDELDAYIERKKKLDALNQKVIEKGPKTWDDIFSSLIVFGGIVFMLVMLLLPFFNINREGPDKYMVIGDTCYCENNDKVYYYAAEKDLWIYFGKEYEFEIKYKNVKITHYQRKPDNCPIYR